MDSSPNLSIAAVERETGISKDVLRKWETRYGFPVPLRDGLGERAYPPEQVNRLRLIKRLMDAGMRPSRIVAESEASLNALAQSSHAARPHIGKSRQDEVAAITLEMLRGIRIRRACGSACIGNCCARGLSVLSWTRLHHSITP